MTASWKSWPNLFHICLLLCATGAMSQQFQLKPLNPAVLQGADVTFSATVDGPWKVMTWSLGRFQVLTVNASGSIISSSARYSAKFCSRGDPSCVEFTIRNVSRRDPGTVICTVQGQYGSKTAHLEVQESGTVNIIDGNMTVVEDQQVEFQCVTTAWFPIPTVSWARNDQAVDSSLYNTTSMMDGDSFNSTSILKFQAVSNTTVECRAGVLALQHPLSSSVFLVVVRKPPDWTVLIAVVVSFAGVALLVLLIIGIIFCCRRRKEKKQSSYQDEMSRRVRTQSQLSGVAAAAQNRGQVNAGYEPEGQTSVPPSELTDSGFCQANYANVFEMPDVVSSNQTGNDHNSAHITVGEPGFRKHRHVTIV